MLLSLLLPFSTLLSSLRLVLITATYSCCVRLSIISFYLTRYNVSTGTIAILANFSARRRLFIFIRKWHRRNSYSRYGAIFYIDCSLHRNLYSGRIILVTKSIVTAAIKIHTGWPFGIILRLVIVSGVVHGNKVAYYTFGVEKIVGRVIKIRVDTGLSLHSIAIPFILRSRNGRKNESYNSYENERSSLAALAGEMEYLINSVFGLFFLFV